MHIIDQKLQDLACPVSLFVPIAGLMGRTRMTHCLQTGSFDHNIMEKLIVVLDEMAELKRTALITPDWSDAEGIREQLRQRRAFKLAAEYDEDRIRELLLEPKDVANTS